EPGAVRQTTAAETVAGERAYVITAVAGDVADLQEVLASLATRGGQRLIPYLRLAEVKPPSRLPVTATVPPPDQPPARRRRRPPAAIRTAGAPRGPGGGPGAGAAGGPGGGGCAGGGRTGA